MFYSNSNKYVHHFAEKIIEPSEVLPQNSDYKKSNCYVAHFRRFVSLHRRGYFMHVFNWNEFLLPYRQMVEEICLKFNNIRTEFIQNGEHSPIESVEGRVKKIASILDKANRKNIPFEQIPEKIEDIAGVRIICRFVEDIDKVIDLIESREEYDMFITKQRDYITNTKPSGYRSYHILIKYKVFTTKGPKELSCEIQVRTLAMNFWATIEHSLRYKYSDNIPEDLQQRLTSSAEAAFNLDKEMGTIRVEIIQAQKIIKTRNALVDKIVKKLEALYFVGQLDKMNELNKNFIDIFSQGSIERLNDFHEHLAVLTRIYKL